MEAILPTGFRIFHYSPLPFAVTDEWWSEVMERSKELQREKEKWLKIVGKGKRKPSISWVCEERVFADNHTNYRLDIILERVFGKATTFKHTFIVSLFRTDWKSILDDVKSPEFFSYASQKAKEFFVYTHKLARKWKVNCCGEFIYFGGYWSGTLEVACDLRHNGLSNLRTGSIVVKARHFPKAEKIGNVIANLKWMAARLLNWAQTHQYSVGMNAFFVDDAAYLGEISVEVEAPVKDDKTIVYKENLLVERSIWYDHKKLRQHLSQFITFVRKGFEEGLLVGRERIL